MTDPEIPTEPTPVPEPTPAVVECSRCLQILVRIRFDWKHDPEPEDGHQPQPRIRL